MRAAYTLMEMMLVMAILVIAAGISVPVASTMLADARLSASGDMVRARMADTRSKAMEQGRPWRLSFIANTGVFQLAPDDAPDWNDCSNHEPDEKEDLIRGELPKGIVFGRNAQDVSGSKEGGTPGGQWETMGVYLPNGGAQDDQTTYFGKPGLIPMRVRLRGLTGAVNVEVPSLVKEDPSS